MIKWMQSEIGIEVPFIDEKATESLVNPERDAKRWVDRELDRVKNFDKIMVVGIGSGKYIEELKNAVGDIQILAVTLIPEIAESFSKRGLTNVQALALKDAKDIKNHSELKDFVSSPFCIVKHPGEFRLRLEEYEEIIRFMTSRSIGGLNWALQFRPDVRRVLKRLDGENGWGTRPISIVDVNRMLSSSTSDGDREIKIFRMLQELVK